MRIAFAMINCNRRDGSARAVNEVAERLARRGHEVHLFARKVEDIDLNLVFWQKVPGPAWPEVMDFWSYQRATDRRLARHNYDIVHSIGPNTLQANVATIQNIQPAKMEILKRHSAEERISPFRRLTRTLYLHITSAAEKKLYTRKPAPLFLPVSRGVETELRSHYPIGTAPVRIIPNAADAALFRPISPPEKSAWRTANGFKDEDFVCIFSGGEWARKGLGAAIRAMAEVSSHQVKLFVAGDDPDRDRYKTMAVETGTADRVVFGGFRKDIFTAMASSDIFLFPSHYEAFSLATIEAAACGLPVVATRINGAEDFVRAGETGEFITHDPGQIAKVVALLWENPTAVRTMGENARALVEEKYTWDRVTTLTEQAYQSILP